MAKSILVCDDAAFMRMMIKDILTKAGYIVADHNGFGKLCTRAFSIDDKGFTVEDWYDGSAVSYVHLAEGSPTDWSISTVIT